MSDWTITSASHSPVRDAFVLELDSDAHGGATAIVEMEWDDDLVHRRSSSGQMCEVYRD
jgi:hypothetical protein